MGNYMPNCLIRKCIKISPICQECLPCKHDVTFCGISTVMNGDDISQLCYKYKIDNSHFVNEKYELEQYINAPDNFVFDIDDSPISHEIDKDSTDNSTDLNHL